MHHAIVMTIALLVLVTERVVTGCDRKSGVGVAPPVRQDISAAQLQAMLDDGRPLQLLDVRRPDEVAEGFIPGAINIPVEIIPDSAERLATLDQNMRTVIYCRRGNRSVTASTALLGQGFTQVFNLLEGTEGWPGAMVLPD